MAPALAFERAGPRGGPTLVLIHPMGGDRRFWDPCRALWQASHDCLAPDLAGHGTSPDPGGALTVERLAGDLSALIDRLAVTRFVAVGCAIGAMVAAALAAGRADCAGLILSNPGLRTSPEAAMALAARAASVRAGGMAAVIPAAVDAAFGAGDSPARALWTRRFAAQAPERYARQIDGILAADIGPLLGKITAPSLVVTGGRDGLLPAAIGREVADSLPGSRYAELPEGRHFIPFQDPEAFAALCAPSLAAWR
jgi:pimeloyl-ACP methyl ester carboxylesterase